MCDLIDDQVGRMLAVLEETGQAKETIVLFTSDHGELLGDHGIYLKGPFFYEPSIHVPLIVAWPGHVQPQRTTALVELTDLAQTVLDAVGLPQHPGMQGQSLWPRLAGEVDGDRHREDIYCEYYNAMPWHADPTAQVTMVRTERFKLAVDHPTSAGELYDLERDPHETRNLWNNADYAQVKTEMFFRLCNRMAWTVDPLPQRRAAW